MPTTSWTYPGHQTTVSPNWPWPTMAQVFDKQTHRSTFAAKAETLKRSKRTNSNVQPKKNFFLKLIFCWLNLKRRSHFGCFRWVHSAVDSGFSYLFECLQQENKPGWHRNWAQTRQSAKSRDKKDQQKWLGRQQAANRLGAASVEQRIGGKVLIFIASCVYSSQKHVKCK